jgi:ribosomal protein S9
MYHAGSKKALAKANASYATELSKRLSRRQFLAKNPQGARPKRPPHRNARDYRGWLGNTTYCD